MCLVNQDCEFIGLHAGACLRPPRKGQAEPQGANAQQVGGSHYKDRAIQPWDFITSNNLGFLEGNIVKYISRWKTKGGAPNVEDLKKARHYLDKLIEVSSEK